MFRHVDIWLSVVIVLLQQVECGVVVVFEVEFGVVSLQLLVAHGYELLALCLFLVLCSLHFHVYLLFVVSVCFLWLFFSLCAVVFHIINNMYVTVDCKFHCLCLRIVKHLRVFECLYLLVIVFVFVVFSTHAHVKLHPVGKEFHRIEHFSYEIDGFCANICEECYCRYCEQCCYSRCSYEVFGPLAYVEAMVASGVIEAVDEQWRQEFRHCYARPYHDDRHAQEPF